MSKFIKKERNRKFDTIAMDYLFETEFGHIIITDHDIYNFDTECTYDFDIESDASSYREINEAVDYIWNNFKERNGKDNE
jgi:hypothetical protein